MGELISLSERRNLKAAASASVANQTGDRKSPLTVSSYEPEIDVFVSFNGQIASLKPKSASKLIDELIESLSPADEALAARAFYHEKKKVDHIAVSMGVSKHQVEQLLLRFDDALIQAFCGIIGIQETKWFHGMSDHFSTTVD